MKTIINKAFITVLLVSISPMIFAQKGEASGTQYGKGEDSIRCIMNLSLYIEYYRHKNYKDAISPWRIVFNECPASRESLYAYGIEMYKAFLDEEKDPEKVKAYSDTILMIHDKRIKYFGDEGKVLGFRGVDVLRYRRMDGPEFIKVGYENLKKSIEIEGLKSSPIVVTTFMSASISLFMSSLLDNETVISDYVTASDIIDTQLSKRADSRTKTAKEAIDLNIKESGALTCENIIKVFGPKFNEGEPDREFLLQLTEFLTIAQCEDEKLYADASEKLYKIEPTAQSAYNLARLFIKREEYETSSAYYLEAIDKETESAEKANYNYELALLNFQYLKNNAATVNYALEATKLKPDWGDPYILIGTTYLTGRNDFRDNFEQQTVFWIAVDMFQRALAADPSAAEKASGLINDYSSYFPTLEDLFFRSIKEGDSYTVKGWINRTTTARARK